jgi:integrase/recombinase XerD
MDAWACTAIAPWLADRLQLPVGPLFCVIDGPARGRAWSATAVRVELRDPALRAGVRRRFAPHRLRHAHAVELMHEGIPLPLLQRQLGHSHLSTTEYGQPGRGAGVAARPFPDRPPNRTCPFLSIRLSTGHVRS